MQSLPGGMQEVRAGFVSMGFPWCVTTTDGKHFPTFSAPSEEWCLISRKPCISGAFQRITTGIGAQHGVGHAGLIDVAQAGWDRLGLALYKLAELPCHCCSSASSIC